jgi:hypothetical protein
VQPRDRDQVPNAAAILTSRPSSAEHEAEDWLVDGLEKLFAKLFDKDEFLGDELTRPQHDPAWRDNLLFNEYFHGDNGAGLGAAHQTGWTGLIADVIRRRHGAVASVGDVIRALPQEARL